MQSSGAKRKRSPPPPSLKPGQTSAPPSDKDLPKFEPWFTRELLFAVRQFLLSDPKLENEYNFTFNMKRFTSMVVDGQWSNLEEYLGSWPPRNGGNSPKLRDLADFQPLKHPDTLAKHKAAVSDQVNIQELRAEKLDKFERALRSSSDFNYILQDTPLKESVLENLFSERLAELKAEYAGSNKRVDLRTIFEREFYHGQ